MPRMSTPPNLPSLQALIDDLAVQGWSQQPAFLPQSLTAELAQECRSRAAAGELAPAAIGRAAGQAIVEGIRGDRILWIEGGQSAACEQFLEAMEALRQALNRQLFLGLEELECHFAFYAPGAYYLRHFDRFRDDDLRTITVVFYLNPDWLPEQGGALRLYLDESRSLDVLPEAGTLACFVSAEFAHEVLPASRDRLSLTGWFRRRSDNVL
ncbi:2OG-Fe(II) oxygenase [Pseudomonas sp. UBA6310]|uniref:2OG-Fe(II) oxygenase n=1 Tax=Pseudomonas sp. UBA6310 TaxID=1947327 RepID=UPI00257C7030|nr:2OG-Fe(II) oxygenase [Pseudomonas sp. UBA6310]